MIKKIISLSLVVLMTLGLMASSIGCALFSGGSAKVEGEFDYITYDSDT